MLIRSLTYFSFLYIKREFVYSDTNVDSNNDRKATAINDTNMLYVFYSLNNFFIRRIINDNVFLYTYLNFNI